VVLDVVGHVDAFSAPLLRACLRTQLSRPGLRELVVDLGGVVFLGAAGVSAIVEAARRCRERGLPFRVRAHGRRHVLRPLEAAGVLEGLSVEADVAALLPLARSVTRAWRRSRRIVLVVALVMTSVIAFVWSHRNDDPMRSLIGLGAVVIAGVPAAPYWAMTACWLAAQLELPSRLRQLEVPMTLALPTVVGVPRTAFNVPTPRVADHQNGSTPAQPGPATQRTATDVTPDIVEEWGS
jgi:anti-sigma B factor antagonist